MIPEYTDGIFSLFKIVEVVDAETEYKTEALKDEDIEICYRELAIFDRTRVMMDSAGINVQMKVCIPQYRKINSHSVVMIDGEQYSVYNAAHVTSKDGFKETELTLTTPTVIREILKNE